MNKYVSTKHFKSSRRLLSLLFIVALFSCSKEVKIDGAQGKHFLRVYGAEKAEYANFVRQTADGGFFVGGGNYGDSSISGNRLDKLGIQLNYSSFTSTNEVFTMGTSLASGGFMLNSANSSQLVRYDESGNLLTSQMFNPSLSVAFLYSPPYQAENGFVYIAYSNGLRSGAPSKTFVSEIDLDGNEIQKFTITDAQIGGKVLQLHVLKKEDDILFLSGNVLPSPWGWGDKPKHFVVKYHIQADSVSGLLNFDLQDEKENDFVDRSLAFSNGQMITAISPMPFMHDAFPAQREFELFKFNSDLSLLWRKRYSVDGAFRSMAADIFETSDGGMLVTGYCLAFESLELNSFFFKLDKLGNVTAQKIFSLSGGLRLNSGIELADGRFVFVGTSYGFGLTKDKSSPIIFVTDRQGNYE